jgi:hypothetical protein
MYTAKILNVSKGHLQEDNSDFLDVQFELSDAKEKVVYKEGFPLDTSEKEIEQAVQSRLELYKQEKERAEANKEAEAIQAKADKTITKLEGKTFKVK